MLQEGMASSQHADKPALPVMTALGRRAHGGHRKVTLHCLSGTRRERGARALLRENGAASTPRLQQVFCLKPRQSTFGCLHSV